MPTLCAKFLCGRDGLPYQPGHSSGDSCSVATTLVTCRRSARTCPGDPDVTALTSVQHAFSHVQDRPRTAERRMLWWALGLNAGLLVVEGIGGVAFLSRSTPGDTAIPDPEFSRPSHAVPRE